MSDPDDRDGSWTLLTGHGHVLVEIARNPQSRIRDLSAVAGITERTVQAIVADLTRTRFCDSSGLHTLLTAHKRAQAEGGELLLVIPSAAVLRVFAITAIDRMIPNFTSLDDALAHTSPDGSNGHRPRDDGPEGSATKTTGTAVQHGTSGPGGEAC